MKNIDTIITAHNRRVISQDTTAHPECNYNSIENWPLQGKCKETAIVYQATVETNYEKKK